MAHSLLPPLETFNRQTAEVLIAASQKSVAQKPFSIFRLGAYQRLLDSLASHDSPHKSCLVISYSLALTGVLGLNQCNKVAGNYPDHNMLDLKHFADNTFDFCVSDQVLEHVAGNPADAMKASLRVIKPGGFVAHATVFGYPLHDDDANKPTLGADTPDYWRYTPQALALLATQAGGHIITSGGHGNAWLQMLTTMGFGIILCPMDANEPLFQMAIINDDAFPIVTWVIAQKPF